MNVKTSGIHVFFLIAALGVVAIQNLVHADEQSAVEIRSASVIAEGISSNPGAVDQITGTGQAGEWLGFKKDSGVFLGGVWAGDTNFLISGGEEPGAWSWNSLGKRCKEISDLRRASGSDSRQFGSGMIPKACSTATLVRREISRSLRDCPKLALWLRF